MEETRQSQERERAAASPMSPLSLSTARSLSSLLSASPTLLSASPKTLLSALSKTLLSLIIACISLEHHPYLSRASQDRPLLLLTPQHRPLHLCITHSGLSCFWLNFVQSILSFVATDVANKILWRKQEILCFL